MKLTLTPEKWDRILNLLSKDNNDSFFTGAFSGDFDSVVSAAIDDASSERPIIKLPQQTKKQTDDKDSENHDKKVEGEIVVTKANSKIAIGKYGSHSWKAKKDSEGSWKVTSKAKLSNGQKSSVSAKINKYLRGE